MTQSSENQEIAGAQPAEKASLSRRRFVRNSAIAVPAVVTLTGGRAMAQTSSALSACKAEMTEMGQVVQDEMGKPLYYRITTGPSGQLSARRVSEKTVDAQTITPSCFISLMP